MLFGLTIENSTTGPPSIVLKSPVNLVGSILKSFPINLDPLNLAFSIPIGLKSWTSANEPVKLKYLVMKNLVIK